VVEDASFQVSTSSVDAQLPVGLQGRHTLIFFHDDERQKISFFGYNKVDSEDLTVGIDCEEWERYGNTLTCGSQESTIWTEEVLPKSKFPASWSEVQRVHENVIFR